MGRTFSPACDLESRQMVWSLFQLVDGITTQVFANGIPFVAPSWFFSHVLNDMK